MPSRLWQMRLDEDTRARWFAAAAQRSITVSELVRLAVEEAIAPRTTRVPDARIDDPVVGGPGPPQVLRSGGSTSVVLAAPQAPVQPAHGGCTDSAHDRARRTGQAVFCYRCNRKVMS